MDGRLARGEESRRAVLARAADIASVEGLDGLTIGRLATELGLSKSGIFALFGSKEELQLAAVEFAERVFLERVVEPALTEPVGVARLRALMARWLDYSRSRVFPGGCFFAAVSAEFDAREGRVHDAITDGQVRWAALVERLVADAVRVGELEPLTDVAQVAFELDAVCRAANARAVLTGSEVPYRQARAAIDRWLG
ncbi:TetR/AcrR family transcriptional regulator [Actinokineospora pegani]|uniref:TetR/AcrR family transcriptional regulator n=1 Tax=Actinokineospora pegani TaxID=2654637 RepID=UPI001F2A7DCC|nr:TetR/AcrR family transcriptional regulator [Actinokineospora pegani]